MKSLTAASQRDQTPGAFQQAHKTHLMQHDWELQCEICLFWTLSNWTNTVWSKYSIAGKFTKLPEVQQHNQLWVWINEVDIYIAENKQRTFQSQTVDLHQLHRSCINDNIAGPHFCIELLLVYRLNQVVHSLLCPSSAHHTTVAMSLLSHWVIWRVLHAL